MRYLLLLVFSALTFEISAQSSPVEHMQYLTDRELQLSETYLSYMSEVAHGNRARKMERKRQELLSAIRTAIGDAGKLRPYNGDATLKDAYKNYWDILFKVFNDDYHKIVDMEAIAEQSYDAMEAYLLAQEKASEVLSKSYEDIIPVYQAFAAKHNVTLREADDTKLNKKMRQVARVNRYHRTLFLIFFKSYKQEMYVWDAYGKKDVNAFEQNKGSLAKVSEEGLAKLDTMKAFNNDGSLVNACRKVLEFHKLEATTTLEGVSDFIVQEEDFATIKKAFEAKPPSKRTQADVENYNAAVKSYNDGAVKTNKKLNDCSQGSQKVAANWDNSVKRFFELHIPKSK